jgi:hypothetical protein
MTGLFCVLAGLVFSALARPVFCVMTGLFCALARLVFCVMTGLFCVMAGLVPATHDFATPRPIRA